MKCTISLPSLPLQRESMQMPRWHVPKKLIPHFLEVQVGVCLITVNSFIHLPDPSICMLSAFSYKANRIILILSADLVPHDAK